jgi:hypothetical protein
VLADQVQVWTGVSDVSLPQVSGSSCGWTTIVTQENYTAGSRFHSDFIPVVARFVRVYINQTGCTTRYARVYEVQVYGVEQQDGLAADGTNISDPFFPNVALNKTTLADSTLRNFYPSNGVDGDSTSTSSRWISDNLSPHHWYAVDLAQYYVLRGMSLATGYSNSNGLCSHNISIYTGVAGNSLAVAVSDTSNWTPILISPTPIVRAQHSGVAAAVAQYVMLTADQSTCGWDNYTRIFEFEIFGTPSMTQSASLIPNVALNKPAVASSYLNESFPYVPSLAVDGDTFRTTSRWVSGRSDSSPWIAIDLQVPYTIIEASIVVGWPSSLCLAGLCSYNISMWTGSATATLAQAVLTRTGWTNAIVNTDYVNAATSHDDFPPNTQGRFVRLDVDQMACGNSSAGYQRFLRDGLVRLYEFQIFGFPVTASPTTSPTAGPTAVPTTAMPTVAPTATPTAAPTTTPTAAPTTTPTSAAPTALPSVSPTTRPTSPPTATPSVSPTARPTAAGSASGSSSDGNSSTGPVIIVIVIAIVVLVLVFIAVVVVKNKNKSDTSTTPLRGSQEIAFDNPM